MMSNLIEAMQPIFDRLDIYPLKFTYDEQHNKYISESYMVDDADPNSYLIIIIMKGNVGTIILGSTIDGINFNENQTLGQIMFDNDLWVML